MIQMIINAENLIIGRVASVAAKKALLGEKIDIVNCEKAVMTGNRSNILAKYKARRARGDIIRGPYFPRTPMLVVKRVIRGMLPYKQEKGKNAFERIRCYTGVPESFKDKKLETIEGANISKVPSGRFMTIAEISKLLGVK